MKVILIQYPCLVDELTTTVTIVHGSYPARKSAKRCKAIWDTGASDTTVSTRAVELLGLERVADLGPKKIKTANGIIDSYPYHACVQLDPSWPPYKMIIWEMPESDVEVLIGMDIISRGSLRIWPQDKKTTLLFQL